MARNYSKNGTSPKTSFWITQHIQIQTAVVLATLLAVFSASDAIFIGGEQDVASPLRVAQCRATCLERVSSKKCYF